MANSLSPEPTYRRFETTDLQEYTTWVTKRMLQGIDPRTTTLKARKNFHFRVEIASTARLRSTIHRTVGLSAKVQDVVSHTWRLVFPQIGHQSWALANRSGWALGSRDYLLIPPRENYSFTCEPEIRHTQLIDLCPHLVAEIIHDVFDRLVESLPHPVCGPHAKTKLGAWLGQATSWMQLMRTSASANMSSMLADVLAQGIVLTALADWYPREQLKERFAAHQRRRNPTLTKAIEYLRAHYADDVDLDTLAKAAGMNKFGLCRVFRQATGETPIRYLFRLRVESAHRQLRARRHLGKSITEIAFEVGFQDASHFTRLFRAHYGVTPHALREQELRKGK